jgi:hypothetical protein
MLKRNNLRVLGHFMRHVMSEGVQLVEMFLGRNGLKHEALSFGNSQLWSWDHAVVYISLLQG